MSDINEAWNRFENALRDKISGGERWPGLQLVQVPTEADWAHPQFGDHNAWEKWGDNVPGWSPAWNLSGRRASELYGIFLRNLRITTPDAARQPEVDAAKERFDTAVSELEEMLKTTGNAWQEFNESQQKLPPRRRRSFDTWYAETHGARISAMRMNVATAAQPYASLWVGVSGGMADAAQAVIDYTNDAYMMEAEAPSGSRFQYRTYNISPQLTDFIEESEAERGNSIEVEFSSGTSKDSRSSFSTHHRASYRSGFFRARSEGGYSRNEVNTSNQKFGCKFDFKNWQLFTIRPSGWFKPGVVAAYGNGEFWQPGKPIAEGKVTLWNGEGGGIFPVMHGQIVVAWQPNVEVTFSQEDYRSVSSSWRVSVEVGVGPFSYSGGASSSSRNIEFNESDGRIKLTSTSERPQVVAVINHLLPQMS